MKRAKPTQKRPGDVNRFAKRSHLRYKIRHRSKFAKAGISGADLLRPH